MRNFFQRDMNDKELQIYCNIIDQIKNRNNELIKLIDDSINNRKIDMVLDIKFYLNESNLSIDEKIHYLIKLRLLLLKMNECDMVRIRVAKPWHPMCWSFYLNKKFPKYKPFKDYIMFGFCVPFLPNKPIMMAHYTFNEDYQSIKEILAHELTHSLMNTKDLHAKSYKDAIKDAWTMCFLY
jgi:hypothetical protein